MYVSIVIRLIFLVDYLFCYHYYIDIIMNRKRIYESQNAIL